LSIWRGSQQENIFRTDGYWAVVGGFDIRGRHYRQAGHEAGWKTAGKKTGAATKGAAKGVAKGTRKGVSKTAARVEDKDK